jgi:hypothetical protein
MSRKSKLELCGIQPHFPWRNFSNPLGQPQGTAFSQGTNQQVGMMYVPAVALPARWSTTASRSSSLTRCPLRSLDQGGWAHGSSALRSGTAICKRHGWNNFKKIIAAGLNAQMSGMGWWTHDIGAISDYRELLVRW